MNKTTQQHLESGAKYSGTSLALAAAITGIFVFFRPDLEPIKEYVLALLAFIINLVMVYLLKVQDDKGDVTQ